MSYTATGIIKAIGKTESVGSNNTDKRELVITVPDGNYSNDMCLQMMKDKVTLVSNFQVGQKVNIHFNIKSNEYNGKYFTNLTLWKIEQA
jgi:hypothetical protein